METSVQLFFDIDDFVPKGSKLSFGELVFKFSQETSLYPAPDYIPYLWVVGDFWFEKPSRCIALIYATSAIYVIAPASAEVFEDLLGHIYHLCKAHNFQGGWSDVAALLQQDLFSLGQYGILQSMRCSRDDFFGNILPNAATIIHKAFCIKNKWRKPVAFLSKKERSIGVVRKVRRRGYNDKGSRRPDHEQHDTGPDFLLDLKEVQYQELLSKFAPPRVPSRVFWYNSLDYEGRSGKRSNLLFIEKGRRSETLAERENRLEQKEIRNSS